MIHQIKILENDRLYDGTQLASHWIFKSTGLLGDASVAFCGGCDVPIEKMVDLVDVRDNKSIFSRRMLHILAEFFNADLTQTILYQRLLVALAQQEIIFRTKAAVVRGGNDLYEDGAKLSVSVATASPVSTLIHFGLNILSQGTPVRTKGLEDYGIDPFSFAKALLESFRDEIRTVSEARAKVRPVG